jgi:DNA-nicking Smr family endonuclease
VTDLTRDVLELKEDLTKAALNIEQNQSSVPFQIDIHTMTQMDAERLVMDFLVGKNYIMALHHVQNLR